MQLTKHLPSSRALQAFIVAARCLSFSEAAKQLYVTQGAISKQIQLLETQLGQALFIRKGSGLVLTEAGNQYLSKVVPGIEAIQTASAEMQQTHSETNLLQLNVSPSVANLWLLPEIDKLLAQNQRLRISVNTGDGRLPKGGIDADVSIRCLPIAKHYEHSEWLFQEKLILVANPSVGNLSSIDEVLSLPLLPQSTRPQLWELMLNKSQTQISPNYYPVAFEHFYMSLPLLARNCGVALLPDFMVRKELDSGALINPLDLSFDSPYGYYLICPSYKLSEPHITSFIRWIRSLER
ncbi:LysR family transcriptional regulator [Vibrio penaeicida]|uniref:LysR family transcriptional regulator n=1 Tax=Vibrio penaeicida TaxID=104609 RepID=A0AAV5NYL4_9VIBR|nr:LysR family transcriptional regulator [Vibrio penaeicida]RTZ20291.1 LysR family transcriptional regulator [Vibrio penaeicida]GLQ75417.1 LysR family transcriptional regulator [Vibrio penaeicida]